MSDSSQPEKSPQALPRQVEAFLYGVVQQLRAAPVPAEPLQRLAQLAAEARQPCTLAVVGEVKAGKSTFINALLGQELAKVGATETTATVNFFRYGRPDDPQRPVRCHYENGYYEDIPLEEANSLQGHAPEVLRRLKEVTHLEFRLEHPLLERITLIDTPGLGSAIQEHQDPVERFLFERNIQQTKSLCEGADAVIYLVGAVAKESDQKALQRFQQSLAGARASALNTVGVLAKVDLSPELLRRRQELADKIGTQLKDQLNTVVPVSAALQIALGPLQEQQRLEQIHQAFRQLQQSQPKRLKELLADEGLFQELDAPIPKEQRRWMKREMPWAVFRTVVETCLECADVEQARGRLGEYAGFERLQEVLEENFFRRTHVLRCHRLMQEVREVLGWEIATAPTLNDPDFHKWLDFLDRVEAIDSEVVGQMRAFVREHLQARENLRQNLDRAKEDAEELRDRIEERNREFSCLMDLEKCRGLSDQQRMELRHLFGLYGTDWETRLQGKTECPWIQERYNYWSQQAHLHPDELFRQIADQAAECYWQAFEELCQGER